MSKGLPKFPKKKDATGNYVIRITKPDGTRPRIKLGSDIIQAKGCFGDLIKQIVSKRDPQSNYRATIKQCIEQYWELKKGRIKETSFKRYVQMINNFLEFLGVKYAKLVYLDELATSHFEEFMSYRQSKGTSNVTINHERDALCDLYLVLNKAKKIKLENPVKDVEYLIENPADAFFYTSTQINSILEASKPFSKRINWHAIIMSLFYTGMRRNELRYLTWEDIDFKNQTIRIQSKKINDEQYFQTKNKIDRTIAIHPELLPVLKAVVKNSKRWVFVNPKGNIISQDMIRQTFQKICKVAGVPVYKLHKTRHSWASLMAQASIPLDVIQEMGGWKDSKTMDNYKHFLEDFKSKVYKERFSLKTTDEKI